MEKELTCAFTGHRPGSYSFGYDEEHPDCLKLKDLLSEQIGLLISRGVKTFLSGMTPGADIWAAESVLQFKRDDPEVRLITVLPCETQADRWSAEQRERYFNILADCDDTVYISTHYTSDCMFRRDHWLVDHANLVLAVYNGKPTGGTAYTLRYAHAKHRTVLIINPSR